MEKIPEQSSITLRVSSRFYQRPNKEYCLTIENRKDFFREFPREEIRVLFYDQLKMPMDTFRIEITDNRSNMLTAVVYEPSIELSDFFNMVEATVRDYYDRINIDLPKLTTPMDKIDWENGIPF